MEVVISIGRVVSVKLRLNGQTDEHQGRQSSNYETVDSLEPTKNDAFSLKTEQKRTNTNNYMCTGQINTFFVIVSC